jgi:hypothetical protein
MPEQSIIVWDLETIPDLPAAARMLDLGGATETEVREALGEGFPKHPLHKIVCIGALLASRQPEGWRVDALGAPHINERSEADQRGSAGEILRRGRQRPERGSVRNWPRYRPLDVAPPGAMDMGEGNPHKTWQGVLRPHRATIFGSTATPSTDRRLSATRSRTNKQQTIRRKRCEFVRSACCDLIG